MPNTHSLDLELSSSQYAAIVDASQTGLDLSGNFTIEAWVKFESLPGSGATQVIVAKYSNQGGNKRQYAFGLANDGTNTYLELNVSQDGGTARDTIRFNWLPTTGVWYHLAVTFTLANAAATEAEFFIDGISQGNGYVFLNTNITAIFNGTADFRIGAWELGAAAAGFLDGLIDDVRVWSAVRTANQILTNKDIELVGSETNLVGYWKLNNNYTDSTSNANNLTASGAPVFLTFGRFWVGNGGNVDDMAHWSLVSGGASGASVPTFRDNATFDASSFSSGSQVVTVNNPFACADLVFTGVTNTPQFTGFANLDVYGILTLVSGMAWTYSGLLTMRATVTGKTVTSAGRSFTEIDFDGIGGSWILQDTANITTIHVENGTLDLNAKTVNVSDFTINYNQSLTGARGVILTGCTLNVTLFFVISEDTGVTITMASGTINFSGFSFMSFGAANINFTFYDINVNLPQTSSMGNFNGASKVGTFNTSHFTFHNFNIVGFAIRDCAFDIRSNTTVTGTFTATGDSILNRLLIRKNDFGASSGTTTITAAVTSLSNVTFRQVVGAGAAAWTGTSLGNLGSNSGITFTTPVTRYWVNDSGSFSDTAHWSATSGGASGASVPLPQDTVIFDANSFTVSDNIVTYDMPTWGLSFDMSAVTRGFVISLVGYAIYITGNFTNSPFVSFANTTGRSDIRILGSGSTINMKSAGAIFPGSMFLSNANGVVKMVDSWNVVNSVTIYDADLDLNGFDLSTGQLNLIESSFEVGLLSKAHLGEGVLTFGSFPGGSLLGLNGTDTSLIYPETATIIFANPDPNQEQVWTTPLSGISGTIQRFIVSSANFHANADMSIVDLIIQHGAGFLSFLFSTAVVTVTGSLSVQGSSGNEVVIEDVGFSVGAGIPVNVTYASIKNSNASGGATFRDINGVDNGGNTGWLFVSELSKVLTETITMTATISKVRGAIINLVETLTITEVLSMAKRKILTEVITMVENFSHVAQLFRTFTENLTITQVFAKGFARVYSDAVTIIDSFSKVGTYVRSLTEVLKVNDFFAASKAYAKVLIDVIVTSDTITKIHGYIRTLTDTLTISPTIIARIIQLKILIDRIIMVDRVKVRWNKILTALWRRMPKSSSAGITRVPKNSSDWNH